MMIKSKNKLAFLLLATFLLAAAAPGQAAVLPPPQPKQGPGGADYGYGRVIKTAHGQGEQAYYIFEPDEPKPQSAPLIVFLHGWGGTNPDYYSSWIEHLVKKGKIVIFPVYQSWGGLLSSSKYTLNCLQAIRAAIELLQSSKEHVKPNLEQLAIVGHSVGGILALNISAKAQTLGLPVPKAIMSVQPKRALMLPVEDLSTIPTSTLLLVVAGDQDSLSADESVSIFQRLSHIPAENKDFVTLVSDDYGAPPLIADHFAPTGNPSGSRLMLGLSRARTDALDYYGIWKLFDALTDAAFWGQNRNWALGNTALQRYMGKWSNGRPVKELLITDHPRPRSRSRNGLLRFIPRLGSRERQSAGSESQDGS